jgi:zinc protease
MNIDRKINPPVNEIKSFNLVEARKHHLSNGIALYRLHDPATEIVKIEWFFPAGNWFQESPLVAFAVNNMLVEGSKKFTSSKIAETVEFYGGQIGYNVDKDNAFVSLVCMEKHLPDVLDVMEDLIKNSSFPEQELELFRTKHKQQFLIEQSKVKNIARAVHSSMMFGNDHPYGYMVVEDDFDNLERNSLLKFYKRHYQARNCRIIVSGNANENVTKLIDSHFGREDWNATGNQNILRFDISSATEFKRYIEKSDAVQSAVRIGKVLFNRHHPDFAGMSVLNCALGGYFGSRLMRKIREEKGYTYGITSLLVEFRNTGYLAIVSELGADVTTDAVKDIYGEINLLCKQPVPADELARVKNYMLGDIVRMFDGPFAQADSLMSLLEYDLDYGYYHTLIESIKSIDSETLQTLACKYFDPESFYQVIAGKI